MKIFLYSATNETAHLIKSPIHPNLFRITHVDTDKHVRDLESYIYINTRAFTSTMMHLMKVISNESKY